MVSRTLLEARMVANVGKVKLYGIVLPFKVNHKNSEFVISVCLGINQKKKQLMKKFLFCFKFPHENYCL